MQWIAIVIAPVLEAEFSRGRVEMVVVEECNAACLEERQVT